VSKVTAAFASLLDNQLMAKIPLNPKYPERICWGCDLYCAADDLRCGNGTIRTQHPVELFGADWIEWEKGSDALALSESLPRVEPARQVSNVSEPGSPEQAGGDRVPISTFAMDH
jgi:hypothetical protein